MKFWAPNRWRVSVPRDSYGIPKINWEKGVARSVKSKYGNACHLCGKKGADTIDHVIPRSVGGSDRLTNLRPAHRSCNSTKGNRLPDGWEDSPESMWVLDGKKNYLKRLEDQKRIQRAQRRMENLSTSVPRSRSSASKRRTEREAAVRATEELDAWIEEQNRLLDEKYPDIPWSKGSQPRSSVGDSEQ